MKNRFVLCLLFMLGIAGFGLAQTGEQVERIGASAVLRENTEVVPTGKALIYAGQVMRGTVGGASGESVDSALNRLFTLVGEADEGAFSVEFSADKSLWHSDLRTSDNYFRFVVGDTAVGIPVNFLHPSNVELQWSADNVTWATRQQDPGDRFYRFLLGGIPTPRIKIVHPTDIALQWSGDNVTWTTREQQGMDRFFRLIVGNTPTARVKILRPTDIALQWSQDNIAWFERDQEPTDAFWRLRISSHYTPRVKIVHPTDIVLQWSADNVTWTTRDQEPTDRFYRLLVGGTPTARVKIVHPSDLVVRADEVVGLDILVERLIEAEGLAYDHGPLWTKPERQFPRVGTPYTLDLNDYVDNAVRFSATGLPDGLVCSTQGIVSGTPTTETPITVLDSSAEFVVFSAENAAGTSTVACHFLVLRRASFDTGQRQRYTGLTTKGDAIVALDKRGHLTSFHAKTGASVSGEPTVTFSPTLAGGQSVNTYSAVVWNGTDFAVLLQYSDDTNFSLVRFVGNNDSNSRTAGEQVGTSASNARLAKAAGLTYKTPANASSPAYWIASKLGATLPELSGFTINFARVTTAEYTLAPGTLDPQGLVLHDDEAFDRDHDGLADTGSNPDGTVTRLYLLDASTNSVKVFTTSGVTGTDERYREFPLRTSSGTVKAIAFYGDYFYVLREAPQATSGVNDIIEIYPDKELYDLDVPDLTKLEFITQGPYAKDDYVRVRATFSGAVDITQESVLRLNVGGTARNAISVSSAAGTTAVAQLDVREAYFAYQITSDDIDADGIETYQFPFTTTGHIAPHDQPLLRHELQAITSHYRVTEPGGLNTLLPRPAHRANSAVTANFAETDKNAEDYLRGVPDGLREFDDGDEASLEQFVWEKQDNTGVVYNESISEPKRIDLNQLTSGNTALWQEEKTIQENHYLVMRVTPASVTSLSALYVSGSPNDNWYDDVLSKAQTDTAHWFPLNGGLLYRGYYYFGLLQPTSVQSTAFTAKRKLPYANLSGTPTIPPAQVQADLNVTDTTSKAYVKGQEKFENRLSLQTRGSLVVGNLTYGGGGHEVTINIPQEMRDYATRYDETMQARLDWQWKKSAGTTVNVQVDIENQSGADITTPKSYQGSTITTTDTDVSLEFSVPTTVTAIQIDFDREDNAQTGVITISRLDYMVDFDSEANAIADDSITERKLKITNQPQSDDALVATATGMEWAARVKLFDFEASQQAQVNVTTGASVTASSAAALTGWASLVSKTGTARTGRVLVFRMDTGIASQKADYLLHIGSPRVAGDRIVSHVLPVSGLQELGTEGSHTYFKSNGVTIPANDEVYVMKFNAYSREAIEQSYHSSDSARRVTGLGAITVTSPNEGEYVVSIIEDAITPALLKADTDTEKTAMRERIEAAWLAGVDKQVIVPQYTQAAGGAGAPYDYQETFDDALVSYADGRPFEVSLAVTVQGTPNSGNIAVTVSIMDTAETTTYDTEEAQSLTGEAKTIYISASLPATATGYILRTVRKSGTIGYRGSAEGIVQVVPKPTGGAISIAWTPSVIAGGTMTITPDFQYAVASRIGKMVFYNFRINVPGNSAHNSVRISVPYGTAAGLWYGNPYVYPSGAVWVQDGNNFLTVSTSLSTSVYCSGFYLAK